MALYLMLGVFKGCATRSNAFPSCSRLFSQERTRTFLVKKYQRHSAAVWPLFRSKHDKSNDKEILKTIQRDKSTEKAQEAGKNGEAASEIGVVKQASLSTRLFKRMRVTSGTLISGAGFIASTATALLTDRAQTRRWKPTITALQTFLRSSGIQLELSPSLNIRLLDYALILMRVQRASIAGRDIRDLVLARTWPKLPSEEESLRYMRYATAVYGESMIRAAEMDVTGRIDTRISSLTSTKISEHIGIPEEDVVLMDVDYKGDSRHLRHFIAVDHTNKKIVLAIRGTFSLSELVVDVAAFSRPFCGGEAHSEMATMAERTWKISGPTILRLLRDNDDYEFIITGHSLGAGCACLLTILCHQDNGSLVDGRKPRCFAYASPPVYTPLEFISSAATATTNFIHERDVVPFLSVDSVRHFFASIRAIEDDSMRWSQRMRLMTGYAEPDDDLIKAVEQANTKRLPPKAGAPVLVIPAAANLWMREKPGSDKYDIQVCDPRKLATLGIQVDSNMLQDHFPPRYEHALHNLGP